MDLLILGAGMAGTIASTALRGYNPKVFERCPERSAIDGHHAVMRVRSPELGNLLGCNLIKIKATKEVFFDGKLHQSATIKMNNLYSLKAYGCIGRRSLNTLGTVERYLLDGSIKPHNCVYDMPATAIEKNKVWFGQNFQRYDYLISTIPMPNLLSLVYMPFDKVHNFKAEGIYTANVSLQDVISDVNQTIYFPEPSTPVYRATLQFGNILIESTDEIFDECIDNVIDVFGINSLKIGAIKRAEQKSGKIIPINEERRKAIIYKLTNDFNILSFGRYAIWKGLRADNLIQDIDIIKSLINSKTNYERSKRQL